MKTVVYTEDEEQIAELFSDLTQGFFEKRSLKLEHFTTGQGAIDHILTPEVIDNSSLLITDLALADAVSGLSVARAYAKAGGKRILVHASSAESQDVTAMMERIQQLNPGLVWAAINKPARNSDILERIEILLSA